MKKLLTLALAGTMALSLAACGNTTSTSTEAASTAKSEASSASSSASTEASSTSAASVDTSDFVTLNIKFATFLTETNPAQGVIDTLQENLNELMGEGVVTITTYASGTLLSSTDIFEGVKNGTAEMGLVQPSMTPGQFPVSCIFEYPGLTFNSCEVACRTWTEFVTTQDIAEYDGVKVLMGYGAGPGCIATKDKQLTSMADFSGLQIRAAGVTGDTISAFGATPTSMEISECYEALRSGLIDGVYTNFGACSVLSLYEVSNYALILPYGNTVYTYVMNQNVWDSMPAAQQELFTEAINRTNEEYNFTYGDDGYVTLEANITAKEKYTINFMEGEFLEECAAAVEPLMGAYIESIEEQGIDGSGYLATAQEILEKYNSQYTWEDYKKLFE